MNQIELDEANARQYIVRGGLPGKYIRTWHYNFLIANGVPESIGDYIQGRAPSTVGSMHYLAKTQQADLWYAKVVNELLRIADQCPPTTISNHHLHHLHH
ncbi:MAG: hypothetical protein EFT35_09215 [Methanophagales archaeon ANME-1-THS]|nr:MAG: hypothetical protein EFT35_09215 [Methanophagales archaeon ANME-1-THS]